MNKTLIYLTDNSLTDPINSFCQKKLVEGAKDIPIISVSQKPIGFGTNICVGELGKSWMSLYTQILAGIEAAQTDYIGICEHDCLYTTEHLNYIPSQEDLFYYNHNCWFVQWGGKHPELNGMYSYFPKRYALSQLVCHKSLLKESTEKVIELLNMGLKVKKGMRWYGEPGLSFNTYKAFVEAKSGRSVQLQKYLEEYTTKYVSNAFTTEFSNLDIRHGSNFTGAKRGKKRCYTLPFWGDFAKIIQEL